MNNVELRISKDWIIPEELIEQYASMIVCAKNELGLIGVSKSFFINRLKRFHNEPVPDDSGAFNIMPLIDGKMIGWGHLSWTTKGDKWVGGELFVYVIPEERRKGLGTRMCRELLQKIPSYAEVLTVWAPKEEPGSSFVEERLGLTLEKEQIQLLSKIRQFKSDQIRQKAEKHRQIAEKNDYELRFVSGEDIEQDIDFPAFIKLIDQIENKKLEWTEEEISKKVEQYRQMLKRHHAHNTQVWNYLAIEKKTGNLVGYTQSLLNVEDSLLLAIDNKTGVLDEFSEAELALSLKYQVLERLLRDTKVTHWKNFGQAPNTTDSMMKVDSELGFEYSGTDYEYNLTRERWERFLDQN
ncbi:MAG: GNAT family N-acetyltransferase [Promethearchaeota archaeon]